MIKQIFKRVVLSLPVVGAIILYASFGQVSAEVLERPSIVVPTRTSIRGDRILLGEIGNIGARAPEFSKIVAAMRAIDLGDAPPPMASIELSGEHILSAIEAQGIALDLIAYSLPQSVTITREGRVLPVPEVLAEARDKLGRDPELDVQVREVSWEHSQIIPTGPTRVTVERLGLPSGGKIPLRVTVLVNEKAASRFVATAMVDDWREVPVLSHNIERGMLISPEDIAVVRINLLKQPSDTLIDTKDVIGKRAKARISAGETLRRTMIDIPPLVAQGKKIKLLYRRGMLSASASAVALDNGTLGESVRVRNDNSKKVLQAIVLNENEVEVKAE